MVNEQKQPENFIIPLELVQAVGAYILGQPTTRPVGEVTQIITALQQLQPAPKQETKETK